MSQEEYFDDIVEDEIWENERREGSTWVPAEDRGNFADRFGRFKFSSPATIPVPKNSRVVEEFHLPPPSFWQYGRNFTTLESALAKGVSRIEPKWTHSVRWRRWVRKRKILNRDSLLEIMSGWLGCRERRGTWKSRYFMLIGGGSVSAQLSLHTQQGEESEDDSSNDGDDADMDEGDAQEEKALPKDEDEPSHSQLSPFQESRQLSLSVAHETTPTIKPSVLESDGQPPLLFYFRRGFSDPRSIFAMSFDLSEIRAFPKKTLRVVKLSARTKIDDTIAASDAPGRFAIKQSSGSKRVLVAASADMRDRWIDALRTVIEEGFSDLSLSPTLKRQGRLAAALRAAKRGQQELRKGLGNLRRSSQGSHLGTLAMTPLAFTSMPLASPPPLGRQVEMIRSPDTGALNLRLTEHSGGKGLLVEAILDSARDANGCVPALTVGDVIVGVQGESLLNLPKGEALFKLKQVMTRTPRQDKVVLSLNKSTLTISSPRHNATQLSSPKMASMTASVAPIATTTTTASNNNNTSPPQVQSFGVEVFSEEDASDGGEEQEERHAGDSFRSLPSSFLDTHPASMQLLPHMSKSDPTSEAKSLFRHLEMRPAFQRSKVVEAPINPLNISSALARSTTLTCLEKLMSKSTVVTYGQLRQEVAVTLSAVQVMDSDEWRLFFRDLLDYWVCDGVKYVVGGLDLNDFTPVILRADNLASS